MSPKNKVTKHLRFELSGEQYSDFWYVVALLNESKKKPAFIKMLKYIKEHKGL